MPIQFPEYQRMSFDEANPMLVGMARGQNLMHNFLQFPQDLRSKVLANQIAQVQAKYAEPNAVEALQSAKLQNIWNPKIWQSEIGLRGAQAGKLGQETAWYGREAGARTALQNAQAQQAAIEASMNQLKMNYLKQMLGNQGSQPSASQGMGQGGSAPQSPMNSPQMQPGMNVAQATMAAQGQEPMAQESPMSVTQSAPVSPNNQAYGIPTPQPAQQDIVNSMMLGIDTFSPRQKQAYEQQQQQKAQYTKQIAESVNNANQALKAKQALAVFNQAMDAMGDEGLKGPFWGTSPSSGWRTGLHPFHDYENEQQADWAQANLLPGAMAQIKEAMGTARFSNMDMQASQKLKVDRAMTDQARKVATAFINGVSDRMAEQAKFYGALGNPQAGAEKNIADLAWQNYQEQFPLMSNDGKNFQGQNLGNWPLYTTPRAIASLKATGTYKPTAAERNTFMMMYPDGKVRPVKKGGVETAFRKGARPL